MLKKNIGYQAIILLSLLAQAACQAEESEQSGYSTLQFLAAQYEVDEGSKDVTITVTRTGSSDGTVSVNYATGDGSAKAGNDYVSAKGALTWQDGDNTDKTFNVGIIDDTQQESNEIFAISLSKPSGGAVLGSPNTAEVTIIDNDTPFSGCGSVAQISKKECKVLVALYDSTDGENWEDNTGWKAMINPCTWKGVTCNGKYVSEISLPGNSLSGKFPKKLNKLKRLEKLDLSFNSLSGKITKNLGKLKNLTVLALDHNELEGKIPKELGNLENLIGLALNVNQLSGKIPKELGNLKKLEWLSLDHSMLDGEIPTELGNLENLKWLFLDYNHFTGEIPKELGKLANLKKLSLAHNQLSGSIPTALGNLSSLKFIALWQNQLTGEIPSELSNLTKLESLELQYNKLSGLIPKELGKLQYRLSYLQLHSNELSGEIPTELMNLRIPVEPNPVYIKLDKNHLTASDPDLINWINEHNPDWETSQKLPKLQLNPTLIEDTLEESSSHTLTLNNIGEIPLSYNLLLTRETIEPSVTVLTDIHERVEYVPNEIIIKRANNTTVSLRESVNATLKKTIPQLNLEVWTLPVQANILNTIQILSADPNIEYAEPNYIQKANGNPNDARFDELWGMHNIGQTGGTADADIDAPKAWKTFTGSHNIVVAVIDSGIDYNHEDLKNNRWINLGEIPDNGVDDDGNGFIDDVYGYDFAYGDGDPMDDFSHGTHCSGTIGAEGNNKIGVVGVNHAIRIMAVKFLDDDFGSGDTARAIEAITYAVDNGAQILNNSWGGGAFSQSLKDAVEYAHERDVLFVAVAGNSYGNNNDEKPFYPSGYEVPNVLAVAATDHDDKLAKFSNYGLESVDLGAPGKSILSTMPGDDYDFKDGTSMATPLVSGAAALLKGYNLSLSATELKSLIMESVDPIDSLYGKTVTGGRLNIEEALKQAGTSWITLEGELSGKIEPGKSAEVTVGLNATGLSSGDYTAIIKIITNDPRENHQEVPVTLYVGNASRLQFSSANYAVTENEGDVTITVNRTGSNNGVVSVDYATSDDTAKTGKDYIGTSGGLYWADGDDTDKTFNVNIIDDTTDESNETFIVSLGEPEGDADLGTPDTAKVTITDND